MSAEHSTLPESETAETRVLVPANNADCQGQLRSQVDPRQRSLVIMRRLHCLYLLAI